jgi:hypothetical protein
MPLLRRFALLVFLAGPACGTDAYTPACPELPRFDIRDPVERGNPVVQRARADAVEAGCVTAPAEPPPDAAAVGGATAGTAGGSAQAAGEGGATAGTAGGSAQAAGEGGASP